MTEMKPATEPKQTITPHLVVRGAAAASQWYQRALGAEEHGRILVPGGRFMQIELRLGDSTVMIADEFPTWASSRRCRSEAPWARLPSTPRTWTRSGSEPLRLGPRSRSRCRRCPGATATGRASTPSATAGGSHQRKEGVMARFGMVGKLVARPGRRGELVELLMAATRELQGADGCELYVVSQDRDELDSIWVFEAWRDEAAHRASLDMPAVRGVIERGLPLIAERDGAKLEPVGGVGLD